MPEQIMTEERIEQEIVDKMFALLNDVGGDYVDKVSACLMVCEELCDSGISLSKNVAKNAAKAQMSDIQKEEEKRAKGFARLRTSVVALLNNAIP
jgi:hypothetical protein